MRIGYRHVTLCRPHVSLATWFPDDLYRFLVPRACRIAMAALAGQDRLIANAMQAPVKGAAAVGTG